ncbi:phosphatase PAP2 family protein [Bacillus suaedaesalsae]|uniref:Phosphatase PAP2 family protein n=1 Tax=Bacillus suaedaesalsae TaxID=2810349 RepID=A0ABS2DFE4_9BACI|nr:phosphatase PAP2 family protein [Bacillus suaedaesalsae]MBM6617198.1 phosphatase PAP2 family protein [Bacillus suaedaesalsae]
MQIQPKTTTATRNKLFVMPFIALGTLILFLVLAYLMQTEKSLAFDVKVSSLAEHYITGGMYEFISFFTNLGSKPVVIGIAIFTLILMWWKTRDYIGLLTVVGVLIGSDQLYKVLKDVYERERPILEPSIDAIGYSFPSGHATVSMAFYGIIIYFVWKYMKQSTSKTVALYVLGMYIFIMGMSRVLLRAHYISDVIAGFAIAFTYVTIWIFLYTVVTNIISSIRSQKNIPM